MKNQGENKSRNNTFDSLDFIHFTADLIGPLYTFHVLLNNILWNFGKIKFLRFMKTNLSSSLLSKHPIDVPQVAEVHGAMYGTWW